MTQRLEIWRENVAVKARINAIQPDRLNAGPGVRTEIFFHGCSRGCPGCFNDWTNDQPYYDISAAGIATEIHRLGNNHISISGGDALEQPYALADLLYNQWRWKTQRDSTILLFTGFSMEEVIHNTAYNAIRSKVNYLVTDPYIQELPYLQAEDTCAGSTNQRFWTRNRAFCYRYQGETDEQVIAIEWTQQPLDEYGRWIQSEQLS